MSERNTPIVISIVRVGIFILMVYLFLLSIGLLGSSFKLLGKDVAENLIATTSNPFIGLLIGVLTTAIVQSSSLTTSLVVALVSAGGLSVDSAVTIVMGANIGTTITCAIVSLGHIRRADEFERAYAGANVHDMFNVLSVIVILPIQLATGFLEKAAFFLSSIFYGSSAGSFESPIKVVVKPVEKMIHNFMLTSLNFSDKVTGILSIIISIILIFTALTFMVKCMKLITASKIESLIHRIFSANVYVIFAVGIAVTAIIQSSSITTSMLVPMIGAGLITLEQAMPITVGANIGTTITALMASLAGNQLGLTIAFVHLLFNICGTLVWFVPPFMRKVPIKISKILAHYFVRQKKLVFVYIAVVFFVLPLIGVMISKVL